MMDLSKLESAVRDLESERQRAQAELATIEAALETLRRLIDDLSGRQGTIPEATMALVGNALAVDQARMPGPKSGYAAAAYHVLRNAREPVHIKRLLEMIADARGISHEEIMENRASVEASLHKATQKGVWSKRIRKLGHGMYAANEKAPQKDLA